MRQRTKRREGKTTNPQSNAARGSYAAAARGHWQGVAPVGYRRLAMKDGHASQMLENGIAKPKGYYCILTPANQSEQELVRSLFGHYLEVGATIESTLRYANDLRAGPVSARDDVMLRDDLVWSEPAIRNILMNPVYVGTVCYGRKPRQGRGGGRGFAVNSTPTITLGAHTALVSKALFERVQGKLQQNRSYQCGVRTAYAFSGVVTCASCGSSMVGGGGMSLLSQGRRSDAAYRCAGGARRPRGGHRGRTANCRPPRTTVRRQHLEGPIIDAVARTLGRPDVVAAVRTALECELASSTADEVGASLKRMARLLASIERQQANIIRAIANDIVSGEDAKTELTHLGERHGAAQRRLAEISLLHAGDEIHHCGADQLSRWTQDILALTNRLDGELVRAVIAPWIASAVFDKRDRSISILVRSSPVMG